MRIPHPKMHSEMSSRGINCGIQTCREREIERKGKEERFVKLAFEDLMACSKVWVSPRPLSPSISHSPRLST